MMTGSRHGGTLTGDSAALARKASAENFPVAARFLPRSIRDDLTAVYGFARFVDDLGDELPGGPDARLRALDEAESELELAAAGRASHPVFSRLGPLLTSGRVPLQPFRDLVEANRLDQSVSTYATFEDLIGYCKLSANPIGRVVLALAGLGEDAAALGLSDDVCTALQVIEHLQDVQEDASRGRVYLPEKDLAEFGVAPDDLSGASATPALRRLVAFEASRARTLLRSGVPLTRKLRGVWKLAVAGYTGGGFAQLEALEASAYDVLSRPVKAPGRTVALSSARLLVERQA